MWHLHNRIAGAPASPPTWDGATPSVSLAYCCPSCGEVWARLFLPPRPFHFITRPCQACPPLDASGVPAGSLLLTWNRHHVDELPLPLLRREFSLFSSLISSPQPSESTP